MGSVVPIAFQALQAFQAVNTVANIINGDDQRDRQGRLALEQLQARQKIEEQAAVNKANLSREEIKVKTEQAESQRKAALKRAVARQRAKFGASGINSNDGSSEAVLLGLFEESDEEKASRERLDNIRLQAIDQNLSNQKRVNTLQRTQLNERSRIKNTSSTLDALSDLFSIF